MNIPDVKAVFYTSDTERAALLKEHASDVHKG